MLVAGTLGSGSRAVDFATKAEALALVPYLRPCLTSRALYYGHRKPGVHGGAAPTKGSPTAGGVSSSWVDGERYPEAVLPALEEMISRHFPLEDSREPAEGSEEATAYALLLRGLLSVLVRSVNHVFL